MWSAYDRVNTHAHVHTFTQLSMEEGLIENHSVFFCHTPSISRKIKRVLLSCSMREKILEKGV
jgi:hypothetical protein